MRRAIELMGDSEPRGGRTWRRDDHEEWDGGRSSAAGLLAADKPWTGPPKPTPSSTNYRYAWIKEQPERRVQQPVAAGAPSECASSSLPAWTAPGSLKQRLCLAAIGQVAMAVA